MASFPISLPFFFFPPFHTVSLVRSFSIRFFLLDSQFLLAPVTVCVSVVDFSPFFTGLPLPV